MSLIAIQYRLVPEAPILVAANREEAYDTSWQNPSIQPGKPRVMCGVDAQGGGTWLGVNQNGLFVGASNRFKFASPTNPKPRGLLCMELLRANSARHAVDIALEELNANKYEGVNFVIADSESGWAVHGHDDVEVVKMEEGLNIIASGDLNDPRDERLKLARRLLTLQTLDSPVKFLAVASKAFARGPVGPDRPSMVLRNSDRGTVCSTLIALGKKPRDAIFQFAAGAPDQARYEDFSPLLRDILSRGLREARARVKA
jgi:hypothetical protein